MAIYEQYSGTNIEKLYENIKLVYEKHIINPIADYEKQIYNLAICDTVGLDTWGEVLQFPRYLSSQDKLSSITLNDEEYRVMLQLIALQLKLPPTIREINRMLKIIFGYLGGSVYIRDSRNMELVSFVFDIVAPDWLVFVLENYDILPRPTGVASKFVQGEYKFFGFAGSGLNGFNQGSFISYKIEENTGE